MAEQTVTREGIAEIWDVLATKRMKKGLHDSLDDVLLGSYVASYNAGIYRDIEELNRAQMRCTRGILETRMANTQAAGRMLA